MTPSLTVWRKRLNSVVLMLAVFFNPLGFDAAFKLVLDWTDSYWGTAAIFYGISALFFILYYFLTRKNDAS